MRRLGGGGRCEAWRRPRLSATAALVVVVAVGLPGACRRVDPEVTGVRIVTYWSMQTPIDQLAIELEDADGEMLGPRELRPRTAAGPLPSGTDLVVYLPDGQGGHKLRVRVQGLVRGATVASTQAEVLLSTSEIVAMMVDLGARDGGPGDAPAAGDAAGDAAALSNNGQPCTSSAQCRSGHCTDGYCCESAGCGPCRACNLPGALGLCRNVPAGTICDATRCHSSGEGVVRDDVCDGAGICVNKGTMFCASYRCNPATIACYMSCTDGSQCAAGYMCRSGRCE